ncbi:MAG: hypothetical protein CMG71_06060 [Candidatus Marinimicrobia bacterium]|nr:hypothetical protein [Candidatus Neomarinimicrobiota bacterium]|tara:strand:- start:747 stop:2099 length:1353 start_codon:yes stop_codon:yes gene_type:complete
MLIPALMYGGDTLRVTLDPQTFTIKNRIESGIETWRGKAVSEGRLNAVLHLENIAQSDSGGIHLVWSNNHGKPVNVDSVILHARSDYAVAVRKRIAEPFKNQTASSETIEMVRSKFSNYTFIDFDGSPYYARYRKEKVVLVIPVRNSVENRFSGMMGYLPSPNGRGRLTGDISLSFSNLFGFGASSQLHWIRQDERSQRFSLKESVPFIPGTKLGAGFGISQSLQDGFYLRRRSEFELTSVSNSFGTLSLGTSNTVTSPTDSGRDRGIAQYRSRAVSVGQSRTFKGTAMGNGLFVESRLELGDLKKISGDNTLLLIGQFHGGWARSILPPWGVAISVRAGKVAVPGQSVPYGEKFRFGGASSLRGYSEEEFTADWMVIHQAEVRYALGENIRLYGFVDGAMTASMHQPLALGIGFTQPIAIGALSLEYAVSRDDRPSEGKIHFRFSGRIE